MNQTLFETHNGVKDEVHQNLYQALVTMVKATEDRCDSFLSALFTDLKTPIVLGQDPKAFALNFRTVRFGVGNYQRHTTLGVRLCEELAPQSSLFLTDNLWPKKQPSSITFSSFWKFPALTELELNTFKLIVIDESRDWPDSVDALLGLVKPTVEDPGPLYVLLQ